MNVLLLWTDQQRRDTLAVHGNTAGLMPNLDALAADSTVFERAYCASPVCTPSRGSFMTGLYPHAHGAACNNQHLKKEVQTLPEIMRQAGHGDFRSAYIGKWHLGNELYAQHGFDEWIGTEDGYQEFFSDDVDKDVISPFQQHLLDKGYKGDPNDPWIRDWSMKLPERDSKPAFIVDRAIDFIERGADQPWVLSMNCLEPHHPLMGPCADVFTPEQTPDWGNRLHRDAEAPLFVRHKQESLFQNGFEDFHLRDEQSWRQCCAHYWGQCRQVDNQYGRFLQYLRDHDLYDETLIVFCSDHGEMMGCHSLFGKGVPYEEAAGIPMLVKLPGQHQQRRVTTPICNVDVLPTLCDVMGLPFEGHGRSLRAALEGGALPEHDVLFVWNQRQNKKPEDLQPWAEQVGDRKAIAASLCSRWRTLVTPEGQVYTLVDTGEELLHDLHADPLQRQNLVTTCSEAVPGLRVRLRALLDRYSDDFFDWPQGVEVA